MQNKLRNYIETLFEAAPKTVQAVEIKEEIIQNTIQKYNDLIAEGKTEEAAFNIAVASIGDVSELLQSLRNPQVSEPYTRAEIEADNKRSAILLAVAVMLYILSVVPCIILSTTSLVTTLGPCLMFAMIAIATGLIIYRSKTRLRYTKADETIVENFKEWNTQSEDKKSLIKAINGAVSAVTVAVYLIISFATGAWHITWIVFLISGAIQNIIKACLDLKK